MKLLLLLNYRKLFVQLHVTLSIAQHSLVVLVRRQHTSLLLLHLLFLQLAGLLLQLLHPLLTLRCLLQPRLLQHETLCREVEYTLLCVHSWPAEV